MITVGWGMQLSVIEGNSQRLDGGSMFGNAPRALWQRWMTPDDEHRVPLACRALLMQLEDEAGQSIKVLFEAGIGCFFAPEMRARFGVMESNHCLLDNLAAQGLSHADIDIVVLSHLHFDHAGGLLSAWQEGQAPQLLFPKAQFIVGKRQWLHALKPHARDKASYIPELQTLLEASGRLLLVDENTELDEFGLGYLPLSFHFSDGHTPGLLVSEIATKLGPMVYASDMIPGKPWVHLPICMGYDRFPEGLIDEKTALLTDLLSRNGLLYFCHDPELACGRLVMNAKGKFDVSAQAL